MDDGVGGERGVARHPPSCKRIPRACGHCVDPRRSTARSIQQTDGNFGLRRVRIRGCDWIIDGETQCAECVSPLIAQRPSRSLSLSPRRLDTELMHRALWFCFSAALSLIS